MEVPDLGQARWKRGFVGERRRTCLISGRLVRFEIRIILSIIGVDRQAGGGELFLSFFLQSCHVRLPHGKHGIHLSGDGAYDVVSAQRA